MGRSIWPNGVAVLTKNQPREKGRIFAEKKPGFPLILPRQNFKKKLKIR
jgi:hypothetical protein